MASPFRVIALRSVDGVTAPPIEQEVMGSKPKFWLVRPRAGRRALWKEARPETGEDWSESTVSPRTI